MLTYHTHGSPNKPAICFLHGFMGRAADWSPLTTALKDDAYCVTVDLPGHGASTHLDPHEYTMEGATQAVADVLDAAGIDRCTLVGYSMGGRAALYFALFHPDRIQRLVLESASPGFPTEDARTQRRQVDATRADRIAEDFDGFLHDWYRQPLFASLAKHDLVDTMVTRRRHNDPSELGRALRGMGTGAQPSLWDELTSLSLPTLLLTGKLDTKYTDLTAQIAARNASFRRVVVPNAGHNVHAERPQAFVSHLVDFMVHA